MRVFALPAVCLLSAALAFPQAKPLPKAKSRAEGQAVNAMLQAQDPDARIKAADDLVTKYANTEFKAMAFYIEADGYQQKGDNAKAIVFGEQAIAADPQNIDALVLLANVLATTTRDTDLDKEEKLTRADKYAKDALAILPTAAKPDPKTSDDAWNKYKNSNIAQAWQALGTTALVHKNTDEAVADYQKGVDADPDPLIMIRAGRALLLAKKPEEAVVWFDKAINAPGVSDQLKSIATSDKARATAQVKK
jgi:tetratricopeptide (TPR) repeat protein